MLSKLISNPLFEFYFKQNINTNNPCLQYCYLSYYSFIILLVFYPQHRPTNSKNIVSYALKQVRIGFIPFLSHFLPYMI